MKDPRYIFTITVSAHVLLLDDDKKVLMSKRPDTWEWGPGRWGITGGKVYEHENFFETIKRKTKQELGFEVVPDGLYQIKQLLIKDKQAFMFFFVAKYQGLELKGEMSAYKWFGNDEIDKTKNEEFSEYFYKDMLRKFVTEDVKLLPVTMIESLDYVALSNDKSYKDWFASMIKKDYDPEKLKDYRIWKKSKKRK